MFVHVSCICLCISEGAQSKGWNGTSVQGRTIHAKKRGSLCICFIFALFFLVFFNISCDWWRKIRTKHNAWRRKCAAFRIRQMAYRTLPCPARAEIMVFSTKYKQASACFDPIPYPRSHVLTHYCPVQSSLPQSVVKNVAFWSPWVKWDVCLNLPERCNLALGRSVLWLPHHGVAQRLADSRR